MFTKWAGISAVAAALQRKNWTKLIRRRQFGNMYVLLVGPPGSGKSVALLAARSVLVESKGIKLTPTRITQAAFYIELEQSSQNIIDIKEGKAFTDKDAIGDINIHHSLTAMIPEMGIFVRPYDKDFMTDLADLFDCPNPFEYKTKTQGCNYAENSWFNLLGACTERYIKDAFSSDALEQGFPARIVLVYEDDPIENLDLFAADPIDSDSSFHHKGIPGDLKLFDHLVTDFQEMLTVRGNFVWGDDAQEFLKEWYHEKLKPYPMDPKLVHYNTRRLTHVSKLALVASMSRSNTQVITLGDIKWAKATLLEVEKRMPDAIKTLGDNQYLTVMQSIIKYVAVHFYEKKTAVPEHEIRQLLYKEVPPYYLNQIIESMVLAKQLIVTDGSAKDNRKFKPGGKYVIKKSDGGAKSSNGAPAPGHPKIEKIAAKGTGR
jgi:hypothetical protein